ncbi:hypothetical protein PROFUN_04942 [Planoprotostelium fungivorum]|uniref:Uncharacterized protein n=1 Tax=Planoprotostelium fungivorum TaxID=1890364 RepID=A0A2P6NSQ4_9EUKA|nr:hypothetical protein PROFUN_04942 [Planoprotostelium fungivorum]
MDNALVVQMMTAMGEGFRVQIADLHQKNYKLTEDLTKLQKECDELRSTTKPDDATTTKNQHLRGQLESLREQIKNLRHQLEEKKRRGKKRGLGRPRKELDSDSDVQSDVYSDSDEDDVEEESEEDRSDRVCQGADTPPKKTRSTTAPGSQERMTRRSSLNRQVVSLVEDDGRDDEALDRDEVDEEIYLDPTVRPVDFFANFKFPTESARSARPESNGHKRRENLTWNYLVNKGIIQPRTPQQKPTPLFCRFLTRDDKPENLIMWLQGGEKWKLGSWMDKKVTEPKEAKRLNEVKIEYECLWQHLSICYEGNVKNLSEIQALLVDKSLGDRSVSSTPK